MMFKPMKRAEVVTALEAEGCRQLSNKGPHEKFGCPCGEHTTSVPRHREITAGVVKSISKQMACLPEGWLQ